MQKEQIEGLIPDNKVVDIAEDSATERAEYIGQAIVEARDKLLAERDAQIAAANAPLHSERESLLKERAAIEEAKAELELLLPAKARQAQREADALLVAGRAAEAKAKLEEMRQAESAPETMRTRQLAISARIDAIDREEKAIAKTVFETWYAELQHVIRAAEHGLFIELLDAALAEMRAYQERHGLVGTLADPYGFLVKDFHIQNLTADGRSQEWALAQQWYRGRERR
jgi:hypothetical protein